MYAFRDLAQHRTRVGFAVSGIAVAIFLLTTVGMLGDSVSYSYVDYASQSEGKVDYELWGGRIDYASVEATIKANPNLGILEDFLPRGSQYGWSTVDYRALNPSTNRSILTYHVGIDIERETSSVQGPFLHANSTPYTGGLEDGECLLTTAVASRIGIEAGQVVTFLRIYYTSDDKTTISSQVAINYTVNAVVNLNAKFGENYENSLFVPLETFNSIYGPDWRPPGTCDHLAINLATPETYYDSRDIPGTILKLRDIGEDIQNTIGFYNTYSWYGPTDQTYFIYMPRIAILEFEQYVNIGMSIILLFVTVLSLVISAVLINGILSTSVEEKIREFGVFRVLGAHRHFPVKLTVIQAFILASTGTAIGIGTAYVAVSYGLLPLIVDLLDFAGGNVVAILGPQTLVLTIGAGIGISMVAGIQCWLVLRGAVSRLK